MTRDITTTDRRQGAGGNLSCPDATRGMTLIEVSITIGILAIILTGVMAALSTGFIAQRDNTSQLECQLLAQRVIEEVKSTPYTDLMTFDRTYVMDKTGKYRAAISVANAGVNLVRAQVDVTPEEGPQTRMSRATVVVLISNPQ